MPCPSCQQRMGEPVLAHLDTHLYTARLLCADCLPKHFPRLYANWLDRTGQVHLPRWARWLSVAILAALMGRGGWLWAISLLLEAVAVWVLGLVAIR